METQNKETKVRECPDCHRQFSSDGSYRVHKSRFHTPVTVQKKVEPTPEQKLAKAEMKIKEIEKLVEQLDTESEPVPKLTRAEIKLKAIEELVAQL